MKIKPFLNKIYSKGFTLIELLVAIAILGVLAAVVLIAINPGQRIASARNSRVKSDVASIGSAASVFNSDSGLSGACPSGGSYPSSFNQDVTATCGVKFMVAPNDPSGNPYSIVVDPPGCSPTGTACASFAVYAPAYSDGTGVSGSTNWVWSSATGSITNIFDVPNAQGGSSGVNGLASVGNGHDAATCTSFVGWTCDNDVPSQSNNVYFYADGSSTSFTSRLANVSRPDLSGVCSGQINHGFSFTPPALSSGSHTVIQKAEDVDNHGNVVGLVSIGTSTFSCP